MLDLYQMVFEEADQERSHNCNVSWRSTPSDLMTEATIIVTFKIHVKGLNTLSHNKDLPRLIEDRHRKPREVNSKLWID